jgi:hypothetical protein
MNSTEAEKLRRLMREWRNVPAPDAGLAMRVGSEVAASRNQATGRPLPWRLALAGVALGALLGAGVGETRKSRIEAAQSADMRQSYLTWINPLVELAGPTP